MKYISLVVTSLLFISSIQSQNIIEQYYSHLKDMDDATTINISGKMFSMMASLEIETEDAEVKEALDFISSVTSFQLVSVDNFKDSKKERNRTADHMTQRYEELITVRDKENNLTIYIDEDGGIVDEIVGIVQAPENFVVFSLNGKIELSQVGKIAQYIQMEGLKEMDHVKKTEAQEVKVYPNPISSSGEINVNLSDYFIGGTATLYDLKGKEIKQISIDKNKHIIPAYGLTSGNYFLQIKKEDVSVKKKVIIVE